MNHVNLMWLGVLASTAVWSTLFSLTNAMPIRRNRNLGILGSYVAGVMMAFQLPWQTAAATWCVPAAVGGLLYLLYETASFVTASNKEEAPQPSLSTLPYALLAWPVMLPEAIEYSLAEMGILKAPKND